MSTRSKALNKKKIRPITLGKNLLKVTPKRKRVLQMYKGANGLIYFTGRL